MITEKQFQIMGTLVTPAAIKEIGQIFDDVSAYVDALPGIESLSETAIAGLKLTYLVAYGKYIAADSENRTGKTKSPASAPTLTRQGRNYPPR